MDAITRDLVIRLRWERSLVANPLVAEQKRALRFLGERRKGEVDLARDNARMIRERWREAQRMGLAANRQEREEHRRRMKDLLEFKRRREEAMGWVRGFGSWAGSAAMWGGAAGLGIGGMMAKGFVDAAREADNARMSIATMIQSADRIVKGPFSGVQESFTLTTDLIKQMRQAALDTPAGFDDIQRSFRDIAVPARMAGSSYKDIIDMSSSMSTLNKVLGFDEGVVSRDVQQLLRGDIGDVQTPMLRAIRLELQKKFKEGKQPEMLKMIRGALTIDPEMQRVFENSPEGRISQMRDEWEMFKAEAGSPVLAWINDELKKALDYIRANRDEVKRWAKALGEGVVDALKWIKDALKWVIDNREDIIGWAKWLASAAGLAVIASTISSIVGGLRTIISLGPGVAAALSGGGGGALGKAGGAIGKAGRFLGNAGLLAGAAWGVGELASIPFVNWLARDSEEIAADQRMIELGQASWRPTQYAAAESYINSPQSLLDFQANDVRFLELTGEIEEQKKIQKELRDRGDTNAASQIEWLSNIYGAILDRMDLTTNYSVMRWATDMAELNKYGTGELLKVRDSGVTPHTNNDFRGSKFYVTQRVETNNPAALARAGLLAGYEAVAKRPIRAKQRPGSVRLANGDRE